MMAKNWDYSSLLCPVTMETFVEPVILSDGHTYEKSIILELLKRGPIIRSPLHSSPLRISLTDKSVIVENKAIARIISKIGPGQTLPEEYIKYSAPFVVYYGGVNGETSDYNYHISKSQESVHKLQKYYDCVHNTCIYIVPNFTLAKFLGLDIGNMQEIIFDQGYFCRPKLIDPSAKICRDICVREMVTAGFPMGFTSDFWEEIKRCKISTVKTFGTKALIENVDLTYLVISHNMSNMIFYNCDFSKSVFRDCTLNNTYKLCTFTDTTFINVNFGNGCNFCNSTLLGVKFILNRGDKKNAERILTMNKITACTNKCDLHYI
jgi:uncharacterized protein YjbI with pentapeptide repeats